MGSFDCGTNNDDYNILNYLCGYCTMNEPYFCVTELSRVGRLMLQIRNILLYSYVISLFYTNKRLHRNLPVISYPKFIIRRHLYT